MLAAAVHTRGVPLPGIHRSEVVRGSQDKQDAHPARFRQHIQLNVLELAGALQRSDRGVDAGLGKRLAGALLEKRQQALRVHIRTSCYLHRRDSLPLIEGTDLLCLGRGSRGLVWRLSGRRLRGQRPAECDAEQDEDATAAWKGLHRARAAEAKHALEMLRPKRGLSPRPAGFLHQPWCNRCRFAPGHSGHHDGFDRCPSNSASCSGIQTRLTKLPTRMGKRNAETEAASEPAVSVW